MPTAERAIEVYLRLAREYGHRARATERDNCLLLAAEAAWSCGRADQAERLRFLLLKDNPHHLVKGYGSFAEAVESRDVQALVRQLQRDHPPEEAERLLEEGLEPETAMAKKETAPRQHEKTREELVLPIRSDPSIANPVKQESGHRPAPPPAVVVPRQAKEVKKMADTNQPRPGVPSARPAPPTARPAAPNIFNVAPEDKPRPRPAMAPIGGLPPSRSDAGGGFVGVFLAAVVFLVGVALLVYTFLGPFVPLGF